MVSDVVHPTPPPDSPPGCRSGTPGRPGEGEGRGASGGHSLDEGAPSPGAVERCVGCGGSGRVVREKTLLDILIEPDVLDPLGLDPVVEDCKECA